MATRWLDKAVAPGRHGTYRLYARKLRDYILPVIGQKRLDALTRADVEDIQRQAHGKGLGPSSIELVLIVGHALLSYAAQKEEIVGVKNPFHKATRLYRAKRRDYVVVSADEGTDLLTVLRPSRYAHAFTLMLLCGLRVNEALGLRWRDIDLGAVVWLLSFVRCVSPISPIPSHPQPSPSRCGTHFRAVGRSAGKGT